MSANINVTKSTPQHILMVVANPVISTTLGVPVGFWASELTHPYYAFTEVGYQIDIASPQGGEIVMDELSTGYHKFFPSFEALDWPQA